MQEIYNQIQYSNILRNNQTQGLRLRTKIYQWAVIEGRFARYLSNIYSNSNTCAALKRSAR